MAGQIPLLLLLRDLEEKSRLKCSGFHH
jgi:hypothetical protein